MRLATILAFVWGLLLMKPVFAITPSTEPIAPNESLRSFATGPTTAEQIDRIMLATKSVRDEQLLRCHQAEGPGAACVTTVDCEVREKVPGGKENRIYFQGRFSDQAFVLVVGDSSGIILTFTDFGQDGLLDNVDGDLYLSKSENLTKEGEDLIQRQFASWLESQTAVFPHVYTNRVDSYLACIRLYAPQR